MQLKTIETLLFNIMINLSLYISISIDKLRNDSKAYNATLEVAPQIPEQCIQRHIPLLHFIPLVRHKLKPPVHSHRHVLYHLPFFKTLTLVCITYKAIILLSHIRPAITHHTLMQTFIIPYILVLKHFPTFS